MNLVKFTFLAGAFLLFSSELFPWADPSSFEKATSGVVRFYTGSPRSNGKGCFADDCHPPLAQGEFKIFSLSFGVKTDNVADEKDTLAQEYKAGETWSGKLRIKSTGYEEIGTDKAGAQNGFAAEVLDKKGNPAGKLIAATNTVLSSDGTALLDKGAATRQVEWKWEWQAPSPAVGPVWLYISGLDGDGDGTAGQGDRFRNIAWEIYGPGEAPAGKKVGDTIIIPTLDEGTNNPNGTNGTNTGNETGTSGSKAPGGTVPANTGASQQGQPLTDDEGGGCGCTLKTDHVSALSYESFMMVLAFFFSVGTFIGLRKKLKR